MDLEDLEEAIKRLTDPERERRGVAYNRIVSGVYAKYREDIIRDRKPCEGKIAREICVLAYNQGLCDVCTIICEPKRKAALEKARKNKYKGE